MSEQKIIHGDCLEIMRTFPDKSFDLVLTDPPYGIGADKGSKWFGTSKQEVYTDEWDNLTPSKEYFDEMLRVGKTVIIFGANFFTDKLPVMGHWIVWDKKGDIEFENPFSACELAWTNIAKKPIKKYTVIQQGFIAEERTRFHPTQKPVSLFGQIINDYSKPTDKILDPFLGSGTSALAAQSLQREMVGIEISPEYCRIAQESLNAQPNSLFQS